MAAVPALAASLLVAGGCGHASTAGDEPASSRELFAAAYEDIESVYISDVPLGEVVVAGLDDALRDSGHIRVERAGAEIELTRGADTLASFDAPETESPAAWAALTAGVLTASEAHAPDALSDSRARRHGRVFASILDQLDRYSRYSGALEARDNRARRDGFGGIGVRTDSGDAGLEVVSVVEGSPAAKAGIDSGATILAVNGERATGAAAEAALERLRGPVDDTVTITVERAESDRRETLQLARAFVVPRTVSLTMREGVAHLKISGFNRDTAETLRAKIRRAAAETGDRLNGYVLDLRDNPGGLLDEAVDVADLFLREGRIVSTHGRHPDSHQYFDAGGSHVATDAPVVVLVNGGSASAAEIVAAALQDANRALVVGTASYGKGTIQTVLRLPNAGELTLTWARFHAPSGYALSGRGVMPDVCTSRAADGGAGVIRTLRQGNQPIPRTVVQRQVPHDDDARIDALRSHCPARSASRDADLAIAVKLLQDRTLYRRAAGERHALLARKR
ncbi:carboxyl-terminal processing protease [Limimonas halophila]|uniref:Carboxyl-terminal processing protease n=1 Tax=Limimonas halophila TaxID=1082479 RepID=A0A1G7P6D3_9PROT|nr:S41 family peptidase [Limimonas halophila]SDF81845.1 carboxyl-terminal processing protease [Limimonas halophila]